jgi:helix-turn-helix protein/uncharacterized protein DUF4115
VQATGIGPALRKARLLRGKSIAEASRETRIRAEFLQALERERFEALLGDVYVRGCLRSYSTYLGMDPTGVLTMYNRHFGGPRPAIGDPVPRPPRPIEPPRSWLRETLQHHPSWAVLAVLALATLAAFAALGLLSRSRSAPPPETLGRSPASGGTVGRVTVVIQADGVQASPFVLRPGETRTFDGTTSIEVKLGRGGAARLTVNGHSLGTPGRSAVPYSATFRPDDYRRAPSASSP